MNQRHLLNCQYLLGKSEIISYIPDYNDLFNEDIQEQLYISRVLKDNYRSYQHALNFLQFETLENRRKELCLKLARKCLGNPDMKHLFPLIIELTK